MTKFRCLVVLAATVSTLAVAAPASALLGQPAHHRTVRVTVPGKVTALSVRNDIGDITVLPGDVTRVVAVEEYDSKAPTLKHSLDNGLLTVSAPCPRPTGVISLGLDNCSVDLIITVPQSVTVDAVDDVGDVKVRDLHGTESLRTSDGDILVRDVAAPMLNVTSDTGSINLDGVRARTLTLKNSDGDIRADLFATPHTVIARNDTGDVALTLPAGIYALDLRTDDGGTHVHGITVHSDAGRTVSAHTSDGDIRITGR
ncbi:MAG TPA: DUF4097 family beta strand repeat-containing protein [Mycobacteriales bacterium]|nr:DUF4097 family beta strand repeat-containing protein [Mycobacteriales bacterium]